MSKAANIEAWLFETNRQYLGYILSRSIVSWIGTAIITTTILLLGGSTKEAPLSGDAVFYAVTALIAAPFFENLLLIMIIEGASRIISNRMGCALCAVLLLAGLHSALSPLWGVAVTWNFLVMASSYFGNRSSGPLSAYMVTVIIHAIHNLPSALVLIFEMHL